MVFSDLFLVLFWPFFLDSNPNEWTSKYPFLIMPLPSWKCLVISVALIIRSKILDIVHWAPHDLAPASIRCLILFILFFLPLLTVFQPHWLLPWRIQALFWLLAVVHLSASNALTFHWYFCLYQSLSFLPFRSQPKCHVSKEAFPDPWDWPFRLCNTTFLV